jgi:hypothetical protein
MPISKRNYSTYFWWHLCVSPTTYFKSESPLKGTGSPDIECGLEVYKIKSILSKCALRSHDYYFRLFIEILLFKVYSYYCENWY